MNSDTRTLGWLGLTARAVTLILFIYWSLYALVTPVTNVDSQIYNISRVMLAAQGGFFNNPLWTSPLQIMFPWAYDAVHLPFIEIGFGYALPSFFSMIGTCLVVFRMLRQSYGAECAWTAMVGLLGLTCLVYQSTSTKNDIPLVFCLAVWIYARWRWKQDGRKLHIFWMIVAIGFMAGTKTTGILYGFILSLWMLYELRRHARIQIGILTAWLFAAVILLGSIETYIESFRRLGNPLGSTQALQQISNRDGIRGTAANLSRYAVSTVYLGPSNYIPSTRLIAKMASYEYSLLEATGLVDAGINVHCPDTSLFFYQSGFEELSGFGPLGTMGIAIMLVACFRWRRREVWWQLSSAAALGLVLISATVGYGDWNNRYLIGHFILTTAACVCVLWQDNQPWRRLLRWLFLLMATASAIAAPLLSFNRHPLSIIAAITHREQFQTCMVPITGKVCERLHCLRKKAPNCRIFIVVMNDWPILPYLLDTSLEANFIGTGDFDMLINMSAFITGDIVVTNEPGSSPIFVKADTLSAPNVTNLAANGTRPPIIQNIYRVVITTPPSISR